MNKISRNVILFEQLLSIFSYSFPFLELLNSLQIRLVVKVELVAIISSYPY